MTKGDTMECDYCGEHGHTWEVHPEARHDVAAWEREERAAWEPFGSHTED